MIRDTLRKALGAYRTLTQREPATTAVSGGRHALDDMFYAPPPQLKRDPYPYGHTSEEGPFLRTSFPGDRVIVAHVDDLLARTGVVRVAGHEFPRDDIRTGYEGVLFQSHILEPRVYEILGKAIEVGRPMSCTSALTRTLTVSNVSGKSLGAVRTLVERVAEEYSVPKQGDI